MRSLERSGIGYGMAVLSHTLRIQLQLAAHETELKDYGHWVLIEPLATLQAIEDFLYPRVAVPKPSSGSASAAKAAAEPSKVRKLC